MKSRGFTLIEVLLALAVVAIALAALLKATAQSISGTERLKEKTIHHWIAIHGITLMQLQLIPGGQAHEETHLTKMFGQGWYWRSQINPTAIKSMQKITITVSKKQSGPFVDPLVAFRLKK